MNTFLRTATMMSMVIIGWMCGCTADDSDTNKALIADIKRIPSCLRDKSIDITKFGVSLGRRLSNIEETKKLAEAMLVLKDSIRAFNAGVNGFSERKHLIGGVDCLIGGINLGIRQISGDVAICWEMRILKIKIMQEEIAWGEANRTKADCNTLVRGPYISTKIFTGERYARSLQCDYDHCVSDMERTFNSEVSRNVLSTEKLAVIRMRLEEALGRPIRSDEEIARDRQRKIDAKIEAARRRKEKERGNDVKVDIDSL